LWASRSLVFCQELELEISVAVSLPDKLERLKESVKSLGNQPAWRWRCRYPNSTFTLEPAFIHASLCFCKNIRKANVGSWPVSADLLDCATAVTALGLAPNIAAFSKIRSCRVTSINRKK
jgi:hypothetical protein